jgi:hypothetical protein
MWWHRRDDGRPRRPHVGPKCKTAGEYRTATQNIAARLKRAVLASRACDDETTAALERYAAQLGQLQTTTTEELLVERHR